MFSVFLVEEKGETTLQKKKEEEKEKFSIVVFQLLNLPVRREVW